MSGCADGEDSCAVAMETEEVQPGERSMGELPEEVLEFILSFLSPYQEHKTAALVCKQWYRLIKGVAYQCYHGFLRAVQEGNIQWESRTYPYPGTPITQRFSHSACYYDSNQSMYVFGGCTQSSCNAAFNDLWRLDLNSKEWIRPLASGSYPSPKAGATLVMYRDLLVLFGGWTRPSPYPLHQPERFFDEIHTYSPSKNCFFLPAVSGPCPHPRGGQSQIVIDSETLLILGGCGGPNALLKDAWLLHMSASPWTWQQLRVENEDHGAPELWCHPACKVGQCVVVFSQAPSGRAPLSPSLNSRPSPISSTPAPLGPDPPSLRSQSPVRGGAAGVVLGAVEEAPCVNGRWGTLRPRASARARDGSSSPSRGPDSPPLLNGSSPSTHPPGAVSPAALRRGLEAVKASSSLPSSSSLSQPGASAGTPPASSSPPQAADAHSIPPIARRLAHHPPQSLNVGKPLYQSLNCKPMHI
ncbi:LOW QUALITY PROTEIN: F-box only protein 42 [Sinocyclocheilus anshuiensis]|uniref:LOW QUALITY PROTEIN: F-box only protein 42 n=1 Tax=Sinocyclocheilus anshuiensis TaxID=1608454 RepID=UPI003D68128D